MIAIKSSNLKTLRVLPDTVEQTMGYHKQHGFVSESTVASRKKILDRQGIDLNKGSKDSWYFKFHIASDGQTLAITDNEGCSVETVGDEYHLKAGLGSFIISRDQEAVTPICDLPPPDKERKAHTIIALLIALLFIAFPVGMYSVDEEEPEEKELTLKEAIEQQKVVVVPRVKVAKVRRVAAKVKRKAPKKKGGANVMANLGFLSLAGNKNIKNAIGGLPSPVKNPSPGVGHGGSQGSGGRLLSGLGKGVKHASVGNTGVTGMGGVGKVGQGGGAGGYGDSYIGSGGDGSGTVLSDVSLSDDLELEGGLDRAVIQATIAKYLSQIRACYERGLKKRPGLTGQVTMDFEINPKGRLNHAKVARTSLSDKPVENCISKNMLAWRFPNPVGGVHVKVNYPFMLRPAGH